MILICDKTISERAKLLRKKLFSLGYPCAYSRVADMKYFVPFKLIVTFTDVFDFVRRTPYDAVRVISIGEGFINSVMNAEKVLTEEELLEAVKCNLMKIYGIQSGDLFRFGVRVKLELFLSEYFIQLRGHNYILPRAEYMIFKYLLAVSSEKSPVSALKLYYYCFSSHRLEKKRIANNVAVDVRNINQRCECIYPDGIIRAKRYRGYYVTNV